MAGPPHTFDLIVLGAGMVGLSTAIALTDRGLKVALVDRRGPAEETSFGNAGLIQAEAVMPYAFPRSWRVALGTLAGQRIDARVPLGALPATAPFLWRYFRQSEPDAVMETANANRPLVRAAVPAHRSLAERAGADALSLWRPRGYLRLQRTTGALASAVSDARADRERFGVAFEHLDRQALSREEPHLAGVFAGAVHMTEPVQITDPGALGRAYASVFQAAGGTLLKADACGLDHRNGRFVLGDTDIAAPSAVVCLGPWSAAFLRRFGVRVPLGVKRGYHQEYALADNAALHHLVVDEANGFVLAPGLDARSGRPRVRLTTGAEFARLDDPPSLVQLQRAECEARRLLPLGEALRETPWRGARPCLPDLRPVIGRLRADMGLWGNFGHHHLGFTLGPVTGRLLAEMVAGETTFTDPAPYSARRFGRPTRRQPPVSGGFG